jgi:hypothetical protein
MGCFDDEVALPYCSKQVPYLKNSITTLPARGLRLTLEPVQPAWLRSSWYGVVPRNFLMFATFD